MSLCALDLFAGIGGLTLAARPYFTVAAAYDQDRDARSVYRANLGRDVVPVDLARVSPAELERHGAPVWLLSPPCQPFTRRGRGRDVDDPRARALLRLIVLLDRLRPRRCLVENVPGFHGSRAHVLLVEALRGIGHRTADVETCPSEHGWPVRRRRQFTVSSDAGLAPLPPPPREPLPLAAFLDPSPDPALRVGAELRRRYPGFTRPADGGLPLGTFTRSYGRAWRGAGPLHWDDAGPRRFSPGEILRIHGFPADFGFPAAMPREVRWRLAGNSVHVAAVTRVMAMIGGAPA